MVISDSIITLDFEINFLLRNVSLRAIMSNEFSFRYNSSSLRFDLIPWQFQNVMFRPMKLSNRYLSWMTVTYNGLSGGFRPLGDSLSGGLRWRGEFRGGWF